MKNPGLTLNILLNTTTLLKMFPNKGWIFGLCTLNVNDVSFGISL